MKRRVRRKNRQNKKRGVMRGGKSKTVRIESVIESVTVQKEREENAG